MVPILERVLTAKITLRFETTLAACWAEIDNGQFEAALLNLVINARDAMPDGGTLTIAIRKPADGTVADRVEVLVEDTGSGMSADVLARAFEPFFTTKDVGKGSGLRSVHGLRLRASIGRSRRISKHPWQRNHRETLFQERAGAGA